ncbi:hypothetical protein SAMN05216304_102302 [Bosea sp. OK403]|jgi:hypothetical protein|uniref:hypothetical protein n=1 Tax=Bosea sp. OK403 TaxID=1855286 RepID=UPI0008DF2BEB|nr:hypothetical protein [Bosea sp. OK403]SFI33435.1 hypothetical protein SAMN05216304_102302 [Bosea sp. OK403]
MRAERVVAANQVFSMNAFEPANRKAQPARQAKAGTQEAATFDLNTGLIIFMLGLIIGFVFAVPYAVFMLGLE